MIAVLAAALFAQTLSGKAAMPAEGEMIRINILAPSDVPGAAAAYVTPDDAVKAIREAMRSPRTAHLQSNENFIFVGHNTPGRLGRIRSFEVDGARRKIAQVSFAAGPLKGRSLWVNSLWIRSAGTPDPARKVAHEGEAATWPFVTIDPGYAPMAGDAVILGAIDASDADSIQPERDASGRPKIGPAMLSASVPEPGDKTTGPSAFVSAGAGTEAVVEAYEVPWVKVRIKSGPLSGQHWYALRSFVGTPESFAKAAPE